MLGKITLLLFFPSRFVRLATGETIKSEFNSNEQLKAQFPEEQLPPEKYKEFEEGILKSTNAVRHSFLVAFGWVFAAIAGGYLLGRLSGSILGSAPKLLINLLQLFAAGILLGATLGLVGWEIQTYGGNTLPEKTNRYLYRSLYIIGTVLLVVSLAWPA